MVSAPVQNHPPSAGDSSATSGSSRPRSLAEFYRTSGYAAFPQEHRSAGTLPLGFMRVQQLAHDLVDPPVPEFGLQLALDADAPFRWHLGDGWRSGHVRGGHMVLAPPDTEIAYEVAGDHELLYLVLPASGLGALLDRETGQRLSVLEPLTDRALFADAGLQATMLRMWAESVHHDAAASLMVDGLMQTLVARLLRLSGARGPTTSGRVGRLAPTTLSRIEAYVEAHLAEPLTVAELAALAYLSPSRFTAVFRATTGRTPWAWVLERRLRRAAERLTRPAPPWARAPEPIEAIATACGFSSQAHLTKAFVQRYGITPGRYRRDACR